MEQLRQQPLWLQITFAMVLTTLLASMVAGQIVRRDETQYLLERLEDHNRETLTLLAAASIEAFIAEDLPELETIVAEAGNVNANIFSLKIFNEDGDLLVFWSRPRGRTPYLSLAFSQPVVWQGTKFGRMQVELDTHNLHKEIEEHVDGIRWLVVWALVSLMFTVLALLAWLNFRPLRRIYKELNKLGPDGDRVNIDRASLQQAHSSREFRDLALSVQMLADHQQALDEAYCSLDVAREKAEAANRAKSEFLAVMSHEIRTPIHGMLGSLDLLQDTGLNADQTEFVDTAQASGEVLLGVINNILDFSKIEAGKMHLESVPVDLSKLTEDVVGMLAPTANGKDLELISFVDPDLPSWVLGDPVHLRQILVNLTGNAIKFTDRGEVLVSLEMQPSLDDTIAIKFSVRDTGIGISKDAQKHLFEAFSQADSSTTRQFGGTGLGLAICERFSKLMGGEIGVESTVGEGSTFWFTVCLQRTHEHLMVPRKDLGHVCALVVDDNQTNLDILERYLRSWGVNVSTAGGSQQAIEVARGSTEFDIVLLDWRMPEMDGIELARMLRKERGLLGIPMILLSSVGNPGRDVHEEGINKTLNKPIRLETLYDLLTETLADDPLEESSNREPKPEASKMLKGRVLLVEDNLVNQLVAAKLLERLGLISDIADNGVEAVKAIKNSHYDLVLMDIQMPEMDGFQATAAIRQHEQEQGLVRTPIVAMTADALPGDQQKCFDVGMDDYLSKPVGGDRLRVMLEKWL